jgi:poly-gamma-glutamate synthesis protein (capsule biosynthesis protein)
VSVTVALIGQCAVHGPLDLQGSKAVRDVLTADVALANLEATVAVSGAWPTKTKTLHLASPDALGALAGLGLSAVTHANNHAFDLGPPGIAATRAAAKAAGLACAGSGASIEEAAAPARIGRVSILAADMGPQPDLVYASETRAGIAGLRLSRAVQLPPDRLAAMRDLAADLGDAARAAARRRAGYDAESDAALTLFGTAFVAGPTVASLWRADASDKARLVASIAAEKTAGRIVVVALHGHHWDADWSATPAWFLALAEEIIAAGADVIAATGAPVLQRAHIIAGRPVFSGLGNAIFHTHRAARYDAEKLDVWRGVALRLTLADDGAFEGAAVLPIAVGRPEPGPAGLPRAPRPLAAADVGEIHARLIAGLAPETAAKFRGAD